MEENPAPADLTPGLYIVATPIGNLGDITLRAIDTLRRCAVIACEDTRVTGKLLKHLGISRPLLRHDDHASERARADLLERMEHEAVVLVSDAGTPLISDPGYRLVRDARARGVPVTSLPGASAVVTALSMAGLPTDRFLFAGFLPSKGKARRDVLQELAPIRASLVFFETGPRLLKTLVSIKDVMPDREIAVCRELTKLFEECLAGSVEEVIDLLKTDPKGEIVLVIGPPSQADHIDQAVVDILLLDQLKEARPSRAAAEVARLTGWDRKDLYRRALDLRQSEQD